MRVVLALLLVLAAAAGPADAALRRPKPKGKCNCRVGGGIPAKFQPVCGADYVTYGNECVAKCANVLIRSNGRCPNCVLKFGNCQCGKGYSPKCSFGLTFSSTCDAACGGYTCPMSNGVCQTTPLGTRFPRVNPKKTDVGSAARNPNFPSKGAARYSYTRAIHLSLIFFESMRSGKLDRQRLAWRGDSCLKCRGPSGENLSKGYYEAGGSFLKLGLVEAFLVTALSDSVLTFPTGFKKSGDLRNAIKAIEWGADYLIAAHSKPDRFVAVFGNDTIDFAAYSSPESRSAPRTSCYIDGRKRGSEIAGEAAAALAAASLVYRANKVKRNTKSMIVHAKQLYSLATKYPGSYASAGAKTCLGIHKRLYASANGYTDELAWAAAWLYRATGESRFRNDARKYYGRLKQPAYAYEFGVKTPGLNVLMQQIDPGNAGRYLNDARNFFSPYLNRDIQHTPAGLAYPYHFGALRPTTQMAFLALKQSKILRSRKNNLSYAAQLFNYAAFQINYVLGDGGRSWLGGYDKTAPTYWWHKPSYNSYITNSYKGINVYAGIRAQKTDGRVETLFYVPAAKFDFQGGYSPQRFTPYGALYGAPLGDDSLIKGRADYSYSEPTADGNAAVTGAFAALAEYFSNKQGAQSDCGLNLGWTHKAARLNSRSVNNTAICARKGL